MWCCNSRRIFLDRHRASHCIYKNGFNVATFKKQFSRRTINPIKKRWPWGKLLLVGSISGIVTFPSFYVKRGRVCLDDLSTFPILLKRKLVILQWCGIVLLSLGFVLWLVGKSIGWLE